MFFFFLQINRKYNLTGCLNVCPKLFCSLHSDITLSESLSLFFSPPHSQTHTHTLYFRQKLTLLREMLAGCGAGTCQVSSHTQTHTNLLLFICLECEHTHTHTDIQCGKGNDGQLVLAGSIIS